MADLDASDRLREAIVGSSLPARVAYLNSSEFHALVEVASRPSPA